MEGGQGGRGRTQRTGAQGRQGAQEGRRPQGSPGAGGGGPSRDGRAGREVRHQIAPAMDAAGPTSRSITARLSDGPMAGVTMAVDPVEGRPPKTIDVSSSDGTTYRYCLSDWVQSGASSEYAFLYPV